MRLQTEQTYKIEEVVSFYVYFVQNSKNIRPPVCACELGTPSIEGKKALIEALFAHHDGEESNPQNF